MFNCASFQWCRNKKCGNTAERTLTEEISVAKANAQVDVDLPIYAGEGLCSGFLQGKSMTRHSKSVIYHPRQ